MKAQRHIRPHVNPLQRRFREQEVDFDAALDYHNKALPLHIDIGCAKGHFCSDLASSHPNLNVLGIEIREELVEESRRLFHLESVPNLRFLAGSANELIAPCVSALPLDRLASASILFPDPWPKRRHHKRRVTQPKLVRDLAVALDRGDGGDDVSDDILPQGFVFLQSDVEPLAQEMRDAFLSSGLVDPPPDADLDRATGWLREQARPFNGVRTERERIALRRGSGVWRFSVFRNARPIL